MGLLDDIRAEPRRVSRRCGVAMIKDGMDKKSRADLDEAMDDPLITSATIARVLERNGHKITASAISRHKRGDCCCE